MQEIKCIGRGGQGAVTFSQILAIASFAEGFPIVQAMPNFGVERRGAPAFSFTRISKEKGSEVRSQIYEPDIVVVLDSSLAKSIDITKGLKDDGILIINSKRSKQDLNIKGSFKIYTVDASTVAKEIFNKDIVNTAMLGAFSKATELISLESINIGIDQRFEGNKKIIELNKQAVKEVYNSIKKDE